MVTWPFLLLPIAAVSGWWAAKRESKDDLKEPKQNPGRFHQDYLKGLNFLLNEQPDKAVDVFIKMLEVDSETVETHIALGHLFRRRGEVDRAIRIHQNLIARPHLDRHNRNQALIELAHDYMVAGVLDRAERLFLEVIDAGEFSSHALEALLDIYQQEKDWDKAINTAEKLQTYAAKPMHRIIAHYYCELAEIELHHNQPDEALKLGKKALATDRFSVRASLLLGDIDQQAERYKSAIRHYKRIVEQAPKFISESISKIVHCYKKTDDEAGLIQYLQYIVQKYPALVDKIDLNDLLQQFNFPEATRHWLINTACEQPSLASIKQFLEFKMQQGSLDNHEVLLQLQKGIGQLLANTASYRCESCGFSGQVLHWHCPSCKRWNTIEPIEAASE